jgi:membrane-associated phospholipid phosphatase
VSSRFRRTLPWIAVGIVAFLAWVVEELSDTFTDKSTTTGFFPTADRSILRWFAAHRRSWLNGIAVDITALGSSTLLALVTVLATIFLVTNGRRRDGVHLSLLSIGAAFLTFFFKRFLARPRPDVVPALVVVSDLSYPSGHTLGATSIYLVLGYIAYRDTGKRWLLYVACGIVLAIALSRMYLGVHYPTDVIGGGSIAIAWVIVSVLFRQYAVPLR